jgi:uncharacterized protein (UPF0332 family)
MVIYLFKAQDCFEKGLLKKSEKNLAFAKKSLKHAQFFLNETDELLELDKNLPASIMLYDAFFHAMRSLLYKDGIKEKSHYCVARYFEDEYVNKNQFKKTFLQAFEAIMQIRNHVQYSVEKIIIEEDLDEIFNICQEFILEVEKVL